MRQARVVVVLVVAAALTALAAAASAADAALTARGQHRQAYVLGAKTGEKLQLVDAAGRVIASGARRPLRQQDLPRARARRAGYRVRPRRPRAQADHAAFAVLRPGRQPAAVLLQAEEAQGRASTT